MRRSLAVVGILALTAGCTTAAPVTSYDKAGVTAEERKTDNRECVQASIGSRESTRATFFVPIDRDAYASCMMARGYTRRSQ
jgi:hypothetical protein